MTVEISSAITGRQVLCRTLIFVMVFCSVILTLPPSENVEADILNSALSFYNEYGNSAIFIGEGQTNGTIYFGSAGKMSKSGTKYKTVGYKMTIKDENQNVIQSIYYQMGGLYMNLKSEECVGGYDYMLYTISLYSLKQRMNSNALWALNSGKCSLVLDACMVITKNGKAQGGMNDNGRVYGKVYESYGGIANAISWSASALQSFNSYFNKSIYGLFHKVSVNKSQGIADVSGNGVYCYGTYVKVDANVLSGYSFVGWNNDPKMTQKSFGFFVTKSVSLTAYATGNVIDATYHGNFNEEDNRIYRTGYSYGIYGQKLAYAGWKEPGYSIIGWSANRNSFQPEYRLGQDIAMSWLYAHMSGIELYGIWEENQYVIVYDNGVRESYSYTDEIVLLEEEFCEGWTFDAQIIKGFNWENGDTQKAFRTGESIKIADLCKMLNLEYTNNAEIYLYGIWEHSPTIKAQDMFFSLKDVRENRISIQTISEKIEAYDMEDGQIMYGDNGSNYLLITNYDDKLIKSAKDRQRIELDIEAKDSFGNVSVKTIGLTFVDTNTKTKEKSFGKIRFIDSKYFGENITGGLMENSRWLKDPEFRNLLQSVLVN